MVVVGPDGVGKSGLAAALLDVAPGPSCYFHFRPPLRGPLLTEVPDDPAPPEKNRDVGWAPVGWLRLGLNFIRFWLGYLRLVRPAIRRGALVVCDRWAYGYVVQPAPLRYAGPRWLASLVIQLLPTPHLVVNLVAPPAEIYRRKQELTAMEIAGELEAWGRLPAPRLITLDAMQSSREMADLVVAELRL